MPELKPVRWIAWAAIAAGLIAFAYFYIHGWTAYHFDAKAHLLVGRRLTDSLSPGYAQMGRQWLPLLHILYWLPHKSWFLYETGLAASLLGFLFYIFSCLFFFRLAERLTLDREAATLAAAIYVFNPNLLFLQAGAFSEPLYLLLMVTNIYYFMRFELNADRKALKVACLFGALAAIGRYEGSILAAAELLLLFLRRGAVWTARLRQASWFGACAFLPVALHVTATRFFSGSTYLDVVSRGHPEPYLTHRLLGWSILYHVAEIIPITGIVLFVAGAIGLVHYLVKGQWSRTWAPLLLLTPSVLCVAALYWGLIYRVRYGIELLPAAALFSAHLLSRRRLRAVSLVVLLAVTLFLPFFSELYPRQWQYRFFYAGPGYFAMPLLGLLTFSLLALAGWQARWLALYCVLSLYLPVFMGEHHPIRVEAREHDYSAVERGRLLNYLRENPDQGHVLVDMTSVAPLVFDSNLPLRRFIYNEGPLDWWNRALADPPSHLSWAIARKGDVVDGLFQQDSAVRRAMAPVVMGKEYTLYRINQNPPGDR